MLRCVTLAALLAAATLPAAAQMPRPFTAQTLRGELVVTQPPEVLLNRQPARLAPGARIRGADNLLLMSGAVTGQRLLVHYTLDLSGHVLNVWVLTPAELARQPWPATPEQAATWAFDPSSQTWSKP
ncbi:MAG: hypothetical protein IPF94_09285 [Betaproteobacteria bacterium]|nr:hypothetical protein [Betaproteobacteria bacterium]